jgi:hypothetical protein
MVELNSRRLKESYFKYITLRNAATYVQNQTFSRSDDRFLMAIGFPYLGEIKKDRKAFVNTKIDAMIETVDELIVLGLVSDFEKLVFDRLDNASGEITKIVFENYASEPFKNFSADFIKNSKDLDKLSIINALISPKLPPILAKKFSEIVNYRNRLAHGKRFGEQSLMSFDDIAQSLDDIINYI